MKSLSVSVVVFGDYSQKQSILAKIPCILLSLLILLNFSAFARATENVDLYTAQVSVETRTAKERNQATHKALAEVFIRASGNLRVIQHFPALKRHLNIASRYLSGYQYMHSDSPKHLGNGEKVEQRTKALGNKTSQPEPLILQLTFNEKEVRNALENAGAPFWPAKRPSVLVWLVQQQNGSAHFVDLENHYNYFQLLTGATRKRGLPLIAPQFSVQTLRISPDEVWQSKRRVILNASRPYKADIILVGRVTQNYQGYIGQWVSFNIADGQVHALESDSIAKFIAEGINRTANQLARHFAINVVSENTNNRYSLFIDNIVSQKDYLSLMEYLESIDVIRELQLIEIKGSQLQFEFGFNGAPRKVRSLLTLDGRLIHNSNSGDLFFNWRSKGV